MNSQMSKVLNDAQVRQKICRMAFEIYEQHFEEKEIVLVGIKDMGFNLADLLKAQLEEISPIKVSLIEVNLDKKSPLQSDVQVSADVKTLEHKVIIIVDDVFNTGKTLAYSFKPFLNIRVKKLQVCVLVDRGHHSFPVQPDYVGYSLSTTINEHIEVSLLPQKPFAVYLS